MSVKEGEWINKADERNTVELALAESVYSTPKGQVLGNLSKQAEPAADQRYRGAKLAGPGSE